MTPWTEIATRACLALALASTGCGESASGADDSTPGSGGVGGKADTTSQQKADFFATDDLYVVDIRGWGGAPSPDAPSDAVSVPGARLRVYEASPSQAPACPANLKKKDRLHSTESFSVARSEDAEFQGGKASLEIRFTAADERFFDMRALVLSAMSSDPSQMREALAWKLLSRANVPAPRQAYAKLCIDGEYLGLFSLIENVDKGFLQEHFGKSDEGNLYRGRDEPQDIGPADLVYRTAASGESPGAAYLESTSTETRSYRLQSNLGQSSPAEWQTYDDLALFVRMLHGKDITGGDERFNTDAYRESVESIFDVRTFLRWAGVNSLLGGWSNYWGRAENYFLYNSGQAEREKEFMQSPFFHFIPWNYVRSFGTDAAGADWAQAHVVDWEEATLAIVGGGKTTSLPLITLLLKNDSFKAYYLDHLRKLLEKRFTSAQLQDWIDDGQGDGLWPRIQQAVGQEAEQDDDAPFTGRRFTTSEIQAHVFQQAPGSAGGFDAPGLLDFAAQRHGVALAQLEALEVDFAPGQSGVDFPEGPRPLPAELADTFECPTFDAPFSEGKLDAPTLAEASGLAVSRKHPGVAWMHNDSGSGAELFAVGIDGGKDLGQFQIANAAAIDWEDMAIGPGPVPGEHYLYVADTGDIDGNREQVTIYRTIEPDDLLSSTSLDNVEALSFAYPDGKGYDAEALLVDPLTADIYLASKNPSGKTRVYFAAAPHSPAETTLQLVATLEFGSSPLGGSPKVTAGDIAPHGELVVLKTLDRAFAFRRIPGRSIGAALAEVPCKLPLHKEPQGEAFGFSPDGLGYLTVSEGIGEPLYSYARQPSAL